MIMKAKQHHPSPATKKITVAFPTGKVYGKDVSDLQDVTLSENKVKGTLNYVKDYDEFEKGVEGNFLAIEIEEAKNGDTVTAELSDPEKKGKITLNSSDYLLVSKIHANTQTITLKNGETTKILDLTGLTLSPVQ